MSMQNAEAFGAMLENNHVLLDQVKTFKGTEEEKLEQLVAPAKEKGYEFTTEAYRAFAMNFHGHPDRSYKELLEDDLESVAGGKINIWPFSLFT